jgi:hypothetical protein
MNINKAIRKQKKTYKGFMLSMCFIFVLLPIILIISKSINIFLILYLIFNEILIVIVMLLRFNEEYIDFRLEGYKITIWCGIAKAKYIIICKKIAFIHTLHYGKNLEIIIMSKSKFRNKKIYPIDIEFLKKYPYVAHIYNKVKVEDPEQAYFYFIIRHGGYKKNILLDDLYRSCVDAIFSGDAIEKIKEYRDYSINPPR